MTRPPWAAHGPLQVAADGHFFEHRDGTPFIWLGDTAWRLVDLSDADIERYLDDRVARGFNVIQFNVTNFGKPNHDGLRAFAGDGPPWSDAVFEPRYWAKVDRIMAAMRERGLYALLVALWGMNASYPPERTHLVLGIDHYFGQFFTSPRQHNYIFGRALAERYRNEPNVIWCVSGEYNIAHGVGAMPKEDLDRVAAVADGFRDGGASMMTIHPYSRTTSSDDFHDADWLTFNMVQSHVAPEYIERLISADFERTPPKPVVLGEAGYEGHSAGDIETFQYPAAARLNSAWAQRYQAYWSMFLGAAGYTYGHKNLWAMMGDGGEHGVLAPHALDAPGGAQLRYLRSLMTRAGRADRKCDQTLLAVSSRGSSSTSPDGAIGPSLTCVTWNYDKTWVWCYSTRGYPFRLDLGRLRPGQYRAAWFDPRNGRWYRAGRHNDEPAPYETLVAASLKSNPHWFLPPGRPANGNDWILVLEGDDMPEQNLS